MTLRSATSSRVWLVLVLLWLLGSLRACALWSHAPLQAYANSYDQTRYTSCFGFHPDRPASIPPQRNSPQAPFAHYRFFATGESMCYWSSELLFTATTALVWTTAQALDGDPVHSVRWVGALRWLVLLGLSIALSAAWLRRGRVAAALANAALLPLLFADPGNTLYLNTFYAEFTALTAAYGVVALSVLWRDADWARWRFGVLALAAFVLATSKIQHLLLPLGLAVGVLTLDAWRGRRLAWRGVALGLGAFCGLWLQVVQLHREGPMMDAIGQYNRTDVVFTALLPFADAPRALLDSLGIDPACAVYSGYRAWQFPDLPERVCSGLADFTRGQELRVLATQPRLSARLFVHGVLALDPWLADNLGQVEGRDFGKIAAGTSLAHGLHAWPVLQWSLLALPLLALGILSGRGHWRRGSAALDLSVFVALTMLATFGVTILGDGLADTAKQGHLVINAALAWCMAAGIASLCARLDRRYAAAGTPPLAA